MRLEYAHFWSTPHPKLLQLQFNFLRRRIELRDPKLADLAGPSGFRLGLARRAAPLFQRACSMEPSDDKSGFSDEDEDEMRMRRRRSFRLVFFR